MSKKLVLLGGGHAHVEVLRRLARAGLAGWDVILVSDVPAAPYSGLIPGVIAGFYRLEEALIDLDRLASRAGAALVLGAADRLDPAAREVRLANGERLAYDLLSIDVGGVPDLSGIPGARENAHPSKPIFPFIYALEEWISRLSPGDRASWAQVGGGAAGVECTLAVQAQLKRRGVRLDATIVDGAPMPVPSHPGSLQRRVRRVLSERGIVFRGDSSVRRIEAGALVLQRGERIPADFIAASTAVRPAAWICESGLPCRDGFLMVDSRLRSIGDAAVFAAGDACDLEDRHLPRAGVFAVRQGPVLAENLRRMALGGFPPRSYVPQKRYLALIGDGEGRAFASYGKLSLPNQRWIGLWKARIDRKWMALYR